MGGGPFFIHMRKPTILQLQWVSSVHLRKSSNGAMNWNTSASLYNRPLSLRFKTTKLGGEKKQLNISRLKLNSAGEGIVQFVTTSHCGVSGRNSSGCRQNREGDEQPELIASHYLLITSTYQVV